MSKRKAFWGQSGRVQHQIPGLVYGEMRDMAVSDKGIFIIDRITKAERFIPWELLESKSLPVNWTVPLEFRPGPLNESAGLRIIPAEEPKKRSCNRHDDCDAAEAEVLARNPGKTKADIHLSFHCHDECCDECFGN